MLSFAVTQMRFSATRCLFNVSYKNLKSTVESRLTCSSENEILYLRGRTNATVGTSFFLHDSELKDYETYSQEESPVRSTVHDAILTVKKLDLRKFC